MNDSALDNTEIDAENLYKEENFTDLKVGHIRRLTPVKSDGSEDASRTSIYTASTNIMTPNGALPLSGEIEATTLEEAIKQFPSAINDAVKKLQEDMIRMQQEQASKIVTPGELRGKNDIII